MPSGRIDVVASQVAAAVMSKERPLYERYGETKADWERYKAEARTLMIERAKVRGMIPYGALSDQMTTIQLEPHDPKFWAIIGDVGANEAEAGQGILSVLVVHKAGDMEPGPGFYDLARYLGRDVRNKMKCFVEEMHLVHAHWSNKHNPKSSVRKNSP